VAQGYGYRELLLYLEGKIDLNTAVSLAKKRTRDYARRQLTWLRSLPDAYWFEVTSLNEAIERIEPILLEVYNLNN
jgi:tRNA dimethylallyltransferase